MTYEANVEQLESLTLTADMGVLLDNVKLMVQLGYLGTVTLEANGVARLNLSMADAVPITASTGDTILYRTTPAPAVVKCVTAEELATNYHTM